MGIIGLLSATHEIGDTMEKNPGNCRICSKPTASASERRKRLALLGDSAESVRQIIKSFLQESLFTRGLISSEPRFCEGDFICNACITVLNNYEKVRKQHRELEEIVRSKLQAAFPAVVQPLFEPQCSPIVSASPLGRRRSRPAPAVTSTPKRLRYHSGDAEISSDMEPRDNPTRVKVQQIIRTVYYVYAITYMYILRHIYIYISHACIFSYKM